MDRGVVKPGESPHTGTSSCITVRIYGEQLVNRNDGEYTPTQIRFGLPDEKESVLRQCRCRNSVFKIIPAAVGGSSSKEDAQEVHTKQLAKMHGEPEKTYEY